MGAIRRQRRGSRGRSRSLPLALAALAVVLAVGVPAAVAHDMYAENIEVVGVGPGPVTVNGVGWPDDSGVVLYQCWDWPSNNDEFWSMCDTRTEAQVENVADDGSFTATFETQPVVSSGDPGFPPGTENWIGNHTMDCQAANAHCIVVATHDWQDFALGIVELETLYGQLAKATVTVAPRASWTSLTDGQLVTVDNPGHRPGTQAMAYVCAGFGYAFPGGCDPISASELTIPASGVYHNTVVPLPRWVWVNDPFGHTEWYDCVNGCSVLVASADNLASPYWETGVDTLLRFRAEPLEKYPQLLTVTSVKVSQLGGITIAGKIDCTAAIAEWGQSGSPAGVNVSWKARQPQGKTVVTAHYDSAIASICHDPLDTNPVTPPYDWWTAPPITDPSIWYVYPDFGVAFKAGLIHVDVQVTGGSWSTSPGAEQYILAKAIQWDGRAVSDQEPKPPKPPRR